MRGSRKDSPKLRDDLRNEGRAFAIEVEGELAGWLGFEEEDYPDFRSVGLDISLSERFQDRGLGPAALRTAIDWLVAERSHHRFTIDPAVGNERAIRAYESLGFKRVGVMRQYETLPDGFAPRRPAARPARRRARRGPLIPWRPDDRSEPRLLHQARRRGRSRDRPACSRTSAPPGDDARDDRVGELRPAGGARLPGLGADEQVRRGLPGQALLRRLRARRRRRGACDRRARRSSSAPSTRTSSRTPARRRTRPSTTRCSSPATRILGMKLDHGGHLTHGMKLNFSGRLYDIVAYGVREEDSRVDMDAARRARRGAQAEADPRGLVGLPAPARLRRASARSPTRSART